MIPVAIVSFYIGGAAGFWLHASFARDPAPVLLVPEPIVTPNPGASTRPTDQTTDSQPVGTTATSEKELTWRPDPIGELRQHDLRLPIDASNIERMKGGFAEGRDAGGRAHEAVDILAPRNTPVHAVEGGIIAKLFHSKAGGTTVYQFDRSKRFCYYYAHLQSYAPGLHEGQPVSAGDVLGYVGTSGNAPPGTPHLHFAIFELTPEKRWWDGRAIDPYLVFKQTG